MLLIECSKIKKYFGERLIIDVEELKIYTEDRIGLVGVNGAGKTTLMNILCQRLEPDEGWVKLYGSYSYVSQLEEPDGKSINAEMASRFGVAATWDEKMSGGEKTRFKLARSLSTESQLLLADEPTSNMDLEGIELLENSLVGDSGGLVLISHDRSLLDKVCNKIMEIEDGKVKVYHGNYSDYRAQKRKAGERAQFEYQQYRKEKKRLERVSVDLKERVTTMRKTPKRMGNSEARLHKMGNQKAKANLDRAQKNIESRIRHLEVKARPKDQEIIRLDVTDSAKLHSKIIIEGRNINKKFGKKVIFTDGEFKIYNGSKTALLGPNGCGKSTLLKMIMHNDESVKITPGAKIGYFSQDMDILQTDLTILENVMENSSYPETLIRIFLARLLFKGDDIHKKISVLSGGERVKVSLAKILLQEINLLILDEPTNYLDINSLEVIEEVLRGYQGALLFVSHDRRLISSVADHIMTIADHKIRIFTGSYQEYAARKNKCGDEQQEEIKKQLFVLQNRLAEIIGRLSLPDKKDDPARLDKEYRQVLTEIKSMKEKL
ncbi:MAG: ribosomal protection-like ABC-F family protein [Peptococcaceae bacterium]